LLVSWCAGGRCGMACSDEDRGRSRRPSAEDRGSSHRLDTRWPGGQVAPCAVCTGHVETRSAGFLVEPQNQGGGGFSGLGLKIGSLGMVIWGLKITTMVSWFRPQNQLDIGLSVASQNRWREVGAGHASRSSSLLSVEASLARVSQSGLKTSGGTTTGGARGTIVEIASMAS
jgi:hypothetical protein